MNGWELAAQAIYSGEPGKRALQILIKSLEEK